MLAATDLSISLSGRQLLSSVSLNVVPGEITAVIGPSGAGKTTLLKALSLLQLPDSGSLSVDDRRYDFPLARAAFTAGSAPWPNITVVFQQLFLWPHLTLRQNILLPLNQSSTPEHVQRLLDLFVMNEFIDRYPNQASLGQRQRVAIVRAMALQPKYILLDEITSSLDIEQISLILAELIEMKKMGVGILLVTHLINFARQAADSVAFIDNGKIIEAGGKEILLTPREERVKSFLSMAELAS